MASDRLPWAGRVRHRSGQAMTEFIVAILAIVLLIVAAVEFVPIFLDSFGLMKEVREESGRQSLASDSGIASADRKSEFSFEVPSVMPGYGGASGYFSEKMALPAANLPVSEPVRIPNLAGVTETLHYENDNGTSEFLSGFTALPPEQALSLAKGAFVGAGWTAHPIEAHDAIVFSLNDRAVAAVHAGYANDGDGFTTITVIARTAGGEM